MFSEMSTRVSCKVAVGFKSECKVLLQVKQLQVNRSDGWFVNGNHGFKEIVNIKIDRCRELCSKALLYE